MLGADVLFGFWLNRFTFCEAQRKNRTHRAVSVLWNELKGN